MKNNRDYVWNLPSPRLSKGFNTISHQNVSIPSTATPWLFLLNSDYGYGRKAYYSQRLRIEIMVVWALKYFQIFLVFLFVMVGLTSQLGIDFEWRIVWIRLACGYVFWRLFWFHYWHEMNLLLWVVTYSGFGSWTVSMWWGDWAQGAHMPSFLSFIDCR